MSIKLDRDVLLREIDDLVQVNDDAGAKAAMLADKLAIKQQVAEDGVASVQAAVDDAIRHDLLSAL